MRIAVIGGGIAGLTIANELIDAGVEVHLFEKNDDVAGECSFANGGQISVCNSSVWNTWQNVGKGLKWLFKKDAPLKISTSFDLDKLMWLARFVSNVNEKSAIENTLKTIQLGVTARSCLEEFMKETVGGELVGSRVGYADPDYKGMLQIFTSPKAIDDSQQLIDTYSRLQTDVYMQTNLANRRLSNKEIMQHVPMQRFSSTIYGGLLFTRDKVADIHQLCQMYKKKLVTSGRAQILYNSEVTEIVKSGTQNVLKLKQGHSWSAYDHVVVANGWDIDRLTRKFGTKTNVYPVKGYSVSIEAGPDDLIPDYSLLHDDRKIVTSTLKHSGKKIFRVAGTAELCGNNLDIPEHRISPLIGWAYNNFKIKSEKYTKWSCLRPMAPDMLPVYGPTKNDKTVWVHGAHGHLGLTLAAGSAAGLACKMMSYM